MRSRKRAQQLHRWRHADAVLCDLVFSAHCRYLPGRALGESRLQIPEPAVDFAVTPFALDQELRRPPLDDHEVDLSPIRIAEVAEIDVAPLGILLTVSPFYPTHATSILCRSPKYSRVSWTGRDFARRLETDRYAEPAGPSGPATWRTMCSPRSPGGCRILIRRTAFVQGGTVWAQAWQAGTCSQGRAARRSSDPRTWRSRPVAKKR